jgi:hypothetical protein
VPRVELLAPLLLILPAAAPAPQSGVVTWVTDGDTFDAPETQPGNAKCKAEIQRGKAATRRATALLKGRSVEVERVGRSYSRSVARVRLGGRDLATVLVESGIARWWPRGKAKPNWCRG